MIGHFQPTRRAVRRRPVGFGGLRSPGLGTGEQALTGSLVLRTASILLRYTGYASRFVP